MIRRAGSEGDSRAFDGHTDYPAEDDTLIEEIERLRAENRRLAISLGGFSAFMASRGLLEDAWHYVHNIHQINEGAEVAR